ncbi:MAG: hypothetical protein QME57_04200 [Patescibacteria group bacterium]|nr:hypothetical protein [Patescibacteria group bacterium]
MAPIFVRPLKEKEKKVLKKALKSYDIIVYKRAKTVLLSAQGKKAPEIAELIDFHLNSVRSAINGFNKKGLAILNHPQNGGRKPIFTKEIRKEIINLLKDKPRKYGFWQVSWSLSALAKAAIKSKIVKKISFVRIWQIFKEEGHSYQKSKTWISSPDPQYDLKKRLLTR